MRLQALCDRLGLLTDPTRLRLLHVLFLHQERGLTVQHLVGVLRAPQSTISRHLGLLREHGFVEAEKRGTYRLYRLADAQSRLDRALLGALETFVAQSPEAREDARRAGALGSESLTDSDLNVTRMEHVTERESERHDRIFSALRHRERRRMLDVIKDNPGSTVTALNAQFAMSHPALLRHLSVLEAADLVHSQRVGRERRLYHNAVPIQTLYDRWTRDYSELFAGQLTQVKRAVEGKRREKLRS